MKTRWVHHLHQFECDLFLSLNSHFDRRKLNVFFQNMTHLGGASVTIGITFIMILFTKLPIQLWAIESALSLTFSHLFVVLVKKIYPRKRPYIAVSQAKVVTNPLQDHSFPSGHTTAIFSLITPYILHLSLLGIIFYPIAIVVGASRVFLGLHYPSDVLAGAIIGTIFGLLSVFLFSQFV